MCNIERERREKIENILISNKTYIIKKFFITSTAVLPRYEVIFYLMKNGRDSSVANLDLIIFFWGLQQN